MSDFVDDTAPEDLGAAEDLSEPQTAEPVVEPDQAAAGPPPPPPGDPHTPYLPQTPYRRLYRSRDDRKIGGVAGGLAEYLGFDPTIVRLAVFLLMFTGVGLLLYVAAWLIVPERPVGVGVGPPVRLSSDDRSVQVAAGAAAIALAIGIVSGSWALLAFALIGGGVWLLSQTPYQQQDTPDGDAAPYVRSAPAPPPAPAAHFSAPTVEQRRYADVPPGVPPAPDWTERSAKPPREPQTVTRVVLSLLAMIAGVGIAAAAGDWWDTSATRLLGIGVVTIGAGIVVGVLRKGGARGLIPLGIVATLALIPVSALDGVIDEGVGDKTYRPTSLVDLADEYEHGIGELTVDLTSLDLEGETRSLSVDLGIGHAKVIVPADAGGSAELDANAGELKIDVPGYRFASHNVDGVNIDTGVISLGGDNGELLVDFHIGFGLAELEQPRR